MSGGDRQVQVHITEYKKAKMQNPLVIPVLGTICDFLGGEGSLTHCHRQIRSSVPNLPVRPRAEAEEE